MDFDRQFPITAIIILLLAVLIASSMGCARQDDERSSQVLPFISDYFIDESTNNEMEMINVTPYGGLGLIVYTLSRPGFSDRIRCSIRGSLLGDSKSGNILVSTPDSFDITPSSADATDCQWMRTLTRYGILGENLTLSYDNNQQMKVFKWNGVR